MKNLHFLAISFLALPLVCSAQSERGAIRGTVVDPAGSSVAGATVTAINVATSVKTPTVSTEAGTYTLPSLPAGQYRVEVEQTGFKKLVRENVRVDVSGTIGLDLQLQLGEVSERVVVEAAAPVLKSESSDVSTGINPKSFLGPAIKRRWWTRAGKLYLPGTRNNRQHVRCAHQRKPNAFEGNSD